MKTFLKKGVSQQPCMWSLSGDMFKLQEFFLKTNDLQLRGSVNLIA